MMLASLFKLVFMVSPGSIGFGDDAPTTAGNGFNDKNRQSDDFCNSGGFYGNFVNSIAAPAKFIRFLTIQIKIPTLISLLKSNSPNITITVRQLYNYTIIFYVINLIKYYA